MEPTATQTQPTKQINTEGKVGISFSEMWSFKSCRQRWQYSYRERIATKINHPALYLGSLIHSALAWYYTQFFKEGKKPAAEELAKYFVIEARKEIEELKEEWGDDKLAQDIELLEHQINLGVAMLNGYHQFAETKDHFEIEEINGQWPVENKFAVPILTPNGNPSNKFYYTGKIDGIVKYLGHYWIHELKTAKQWSEGDVDLLPIDPQVAGYIYGAEKHFGIKIAGAIYTVLKKSMLRQGKAETIEGFHSRVVVDYAKRPEFYYARNPIYINRDAVDQVPYALWEVAKDMSSPRIYKSVGKSTCGFGCAFRRLCTCTDGNQYQDTKETFFRQKKVKHEELEDG